MDGADPSRDGLGAPRRPVSLAANRQARRRSAAVAVPWLSVPYSVAIRTVRSHSKPSSSNVGRRTAAACPVAVWLPALRARKP